MQVIRKIDRSLLMVAVLVAVLVFISNPQIASAEISVDSYCQLTIQSMQQEVSQFQPCRLG